LTHKKRKKNFGLLPFHNSPVASLHYTCSRKPIYRPGSPHTQTDREGSEIMSYYRQNRVNSQSKTYKNKNSRERKKNKRKRRIPSPIWHQPLFVILYGKAGGEIEIRLLEEPAYCLQISEEEEQAELSTLDPSTKDCSIVWTTKRQAR